RASVVMISTRRCRRSSNRKERSMKLSKFFLSGSNLDEKINVAFRGLFATNERAKKSDLLYTEFFQPGRMIAESFEDFLLGLNTCVPIHNLLLASRALIPASF